MFFGFKVSEKNLWIYNDLLDFWLFWCKCRFNTRQAIRSAFGGHR